MYHRITAKIASHFRIIGRFSRRANLIPDKLAGNVKIGNIRKLGNVKMGKMGKPGNLKSGKTAKMAGTIVA